MNMAVHLNGHDSPSVVEHPFCSLDLLIKSTVNVQVMHCMWSKQRKSLPWDGWLGQICISYRARAKREAPMLRSSALSAYLLEPAKVRTQHTKNTPTYLKEEYTSDKTKHHPCKCQNDITLRGILRTACKHPKPRAQLAFSFPTSYTKTLSSSTQVDPSTIVTHILTPDAAYHRDITLDTASRSFPQDSSKWHRFLCVFRNNSAS